MIFLGYILTFGWVFLVLGLTLALKKTPRTVSEFEKLPEEVRRVVGHPSQLYEWAMLDTREVNTVIASNFRRAWRARTEARKSLGCGMLPRLGDGE